MTPTVRRSDLRRTGVVLVRLAGLMPFALAASAGATGFLAFWLSEPHLPDMSGWWLVLAVCLAPVLAVQALGPFVVDWWLRDLSDARRGRAAVAIGAVGVWWHSSAGTRLAIHAFHWYEAQQVAGPSPLLPSLPAGDLVEFGAGTALVLLARPLAAWVARSRRAGS